MVENLETERDIKAQTPVALTIAHFNNLYPCHNPPIQSVSRTPARERTEPPRRPFTIIEITTGPLAAFYGKKLFGLQGYVWLSRIPGPEAPYWERPDILFVEIPKTGSLSIQRSRNLDFCLGHMYGRFIPKKFRYKIRTIVRNPYDRLVSAYLFMIRGGFRNNLHYLYIRDNYHSFEDWVLRGLEKDSTRWIPEFCDMEPIIAQSEWLLDSDNKETATLIIDPKQIGRFETLEADAKRLFTIEKLPHLNKSTRKPWSEYYQNHMVADKVYYLYRQDFELFGYDRYFPQPLLHPTQ